MQRDSTSRPRLSVPNQCVHDGGLKRSIGAISLKPYGAIHCAVRPTITKNNSITPPAAPSGLSRKRRATKPVERGRACTGKVIAAGTADIGLGSPVAAAFVRTPERGKAAGGCAPALECGGQPAAGS